MTKEPKSDNRAISTLTFDLIVLMNLIVKPFNAGLGADLNVSLSEWRCIMWLAAYPGGSGQATADGIGMDRMGVSRNLRSLEAKDHVTRAEDPADKKRWKWRLTQSGWNVYERIIPSAIARDAAFSQPISNAERDALRTVLRKAIDTLRELPR